MEALLPRLFDFPTGFVVDSAHLLLLGVFHLLSPRVESETVQDFMTVMITIELFQVIMSSMHNGNYMLDIDILEQLTSDQVMGDTVNLVRKRYSILLVVTMEITSTINLHMVNGLIRMGHP